VPPPTVLYVEGPRDRDVLEGWARAASVPLARAVRETAVILGGRQLGRAVSHFAEAAAARPGLGGLCVLDRDDAAEAPGGADGLEIFMWSRRHIESYLLVPAAIQRALRLPEHDGRVSRLLRQHLPTRPTRARCATSTPSACSGPRGPSLAPSAGLWRSGASRGPCGPRSCMGTSRGCSRAYAKDCSPPRFW